MGNGDYCRVYVCPIATLRDACTCVAPQVPPGRPSNEPFIPVLLSLADEWVPFMVDPSLPPDQVHQRCLALLGVGPSTQVIWAPIVFHPLLRSVFCLPIEAATHRPDPSTYHFILDASMHR
jgi:hypothetical protein